MEKSLINGRLAMRLAMLSTAIMVLAWPACAERLASLDKVVNPHCLRAYSERLYLLQDGTVYVYRCGDGRFLKAFGRSGEGPGETRAFPTRGNMLRVNDRGVFIDARHKIVWFDFNGMLLKEFKKPYGHFVVEPLQNGWITLCREPTPKGINLTVTRCAMDFNILARYTSCTSKRTGFSLFPDQLNFVAPGRSFYIENSRKGFIISKYNGDGSLDRNIQSKAPPVKIPPGDVDYAWSELAADPETRAYGGLEQVKKMLAITVPDNYPAIKELSADRTHLFVKTFRRKADTCEFIVFDHLGQEVGIADLPATPPDAFDDYLTGRLDRYYAFAGDCYYYLRENAAEELWELHRVKWTDSIRRLRRPGSTVIPGDQVGN